MLLKEMKQELKAMAAGIRESRREFKARHSRVSRWEKGFPNCHQYGHPEYKLRQQFIDKPENKTWFAWTADPYEFRKKHVIYCMLRGRKYEEIEPKVKPENELDMGAIEKAVEFYQRKMFQEAADAQAVCLSAG